MKPKYLEVIMRFDTEDESKKFFNQIFKINELAVLLKDLNIDCCINQISCINKRHGPLVQIVATEKTHQENELAKLNPKNAK